MPTTPKKIPSSTSTTRQAVLSALQAAFPDPVQPDELFAIAGRPYPSRIGELRDRGWDIRTGTEAVPSYRLQSLVKGEPDPMSWGFKTRLGPVSGLQVSEASTGKVRLPPESWARLEAKIRALVEEELALAGIQVPGSVQNLHSQVEPDEEDPHAWMDVLAAYQDEED